MLRVAALAGAVALGPGLAPDLGAAAGGAGAARAEGAAPDDTATHGGGPAEHARILAAEILVVRADLAQIARPDLPPRHRAGFVDRVAGALGLIPWLLVRAGDPDGAATVAEWQARWTGAAGEMRGLDRALARLSARHPLDVAAFETGVTHRDLAEARAIHDAYCAGCHDDAGTGDPDAALAARDLFRMARDEAPDQFLARLVNGVKGDESIGFVNPLTDRQVAAMWRLYTWH